MFTIAIEEDDNHEDRYKKIHAEGCKHLIDPEPLGSVESRDDVIEAASGVAILDEVTDDEETRAVIDAALAPCASRTLAWKQA